VKIESKLKKANFRHSRSMYQSIGQTILVLLGDLLSIIQILIIFLGVIEVPMFCLEFYQMTLAYFKSNVNAPSWPKRRKWNNQKTFSKDVQESIENQKSETGTHAPLSLSFYRYLIIRHFYLAVALFPHLFFVPLKLLGVLFIPLIFYLRMRFSRAALSSRPKSEGEELPEIPQKELPEIPKEGDNKKELKEGDNKKENEKRGKDIGFSRYDGWEKSKLFSFISTPMYWTFVVSETRLNFWGLDQMLILNSICFVLTLTHELGWFFFVINYLLISILTIASPLWQSKVKKMLGWETLGGGPDGLIFRIFEGTLLMIQVAFSWLFILLNFVALILPLLIGMVFSYSTTFSLQSDYIPTNVEYWSAVFSNDLGSLLVELRWFVWFIQAYWILVFASGMHMTIRWLRKHMNFWDPLSAYLWFIRRVVQGKMWGFYRWLLGGPTQFFWQKRNSLKIGGVLMLLIFIVWAYWIILLPILLDKFHSQEAALYSLIPVIPICLILSYRGYKIMKDSYQEVNFHLHFLFLHHF